MNGTLQGYSLQPHKGILSAVLFFMLLVSAIGCMNYYKVASHKGGTLNTNALLLNALSHVIIHFKDTVYALHNASINSDMLTGTIVPVNDVEAKYLHPSSLKKSSYLRRDRATVLNMLQIYTDGSSLPANSQISIPLSSITSVNANEINVGATTRSHLLGIGILLVTIFLVFGLVASSAFSDWN